MKDKQLRKLCKILAPSPESLVSTASSIVNSEDEKIIANHGTPSFGLVDLNGHGSRQAIEGTCSSSPAEGTQNKETHVVEDRTEDINLRSLSQRGTGKVHGNENSTIRGCNSSHADDGGFTHAICYDGRRSTDNRLVRNLENVQTGCEWGTIDARLNQHFLESDAQNVIPKPTGAHDPLRADQDDRSLFLLRQFNYSRDGKEKTLDVEEQQSQLTGENGQKNISNFSSLNKDVTNNTSYQHLSSNSPENAMAEGALVNAEKRAPANLKTGMSRDAIIRKELARKAKIHLFATIPKLSTGDEDILEPIENIVYADGTTHLGSNPNTLVQHEPRIGKNGGKVPSIATEPSDQSAPVSSVYSATSSFPISPKLPRRGRPRKNRQRGNTTPVLPEIGVTEAAGSHKCVLPRRGRPRKNCQRGNKSHVRYDSRVIESPGSHKLVLPRRGRPSKSSQSGNTGLVRSEIRTIDCQESHKWEVPRCGRPKKRKEWEKAAPVDIEMMTIDSSGSCVRRQKDKPWPDCSKTIASAINANTKRHQNAQNQAKKVNYDQLNVKPFRRQRTKYKTNRKPMIPISGHEPNVIKLDCQTDSKPPFKPVKRLSNSLDIQTFGGGDAVRGDIEGLAPLEGGSKMHSEIIPNLSLIQSPTEHIYPTRSKSKQLVPPKSGTKRKVSFSDDLDIIPLQSSTKKQKISKMSLETVLNPFSIEASTQHIKTVNSR